jgi:hypothetical protein
MQVSTDFLPELGYTRADSKNSLNSGRYVRMVISIFPVISELSEVLEHKHIETMLIDLVELTFAFRPEQEYVSKITIRIDRRK